jgi:hypothetical protein
VLLPAFAVFEQQEDAVNGSFYDRERVLENAVSSSTKRRWIAQR